MAQSSHLDGLNAAHVHSDLADQAVLIIDAMELRRAGVISLLKPWAESNGMSIVALAPCGPSPNPNGPPFKMVLLVIGALGVRDPEPRSWITSLCSMYASVPLVLVSDREEAEEVIAAFEAGARGFIPTSISPSVAIQAFTFIMSGGSFFPPAALIHVMRRGRDPENDSSREGAISVAASAHNSALTIRQQEVLGRLQQGESNKIIGRQLKMRESTVKVHIRHIMRKLGAANRTQAALCAVQLMTSHPPTERDEPLQRADSRDEERDMREKQASAARAAHDVPIVPSPALEPKLLRVRVSRLAATRR
jgi:DNA-binding NarL/FixJ family response regulator